MKEKKNTKKKFIDRIEAFLFKTENLLKLIAMTKKALVGSETPEPELEKLRDGIRAYRQNSIVGRAEFEKEQEDLNDVEEEKDTSNFFEQLEDKIP